MALLALILSIVNLTLVTWLLLVYLPARAQADVKMANLLHMVHEDWKKSNTRIIPSKKPVSRQEEERGNPIQ